MLKIGEVSALTGVPVKTIRFWEELGLIKPAFVDVYTGYRQFDEKNIERLSQIVYLKNLGFELKEIKELDEEVIANKTKELKKKISKIKANIREISSLQKDKKGEYIMKNFVNDKQAIGHWTLEGVCNKKEDAEKGKVKQDKDFRIKDLYLMENGERYWVIGWTKGAIFICGRKNPYTILGDKMIVEITYDNEVECYAVYKKVDSISHKVEDFMIKDNIDLPFVTDKNVLGVWEVIDVVSDKNQFNPQSKFWKGDIRINKFSFLPSGELVIEFNDKKLNKISWTKGHVLAQFINADMKYQIVKKDNQEYLIMEWKSGDYSYAGQINCYYVFKKIA